MCANAYDKCPCTDPEGGQGSGPPPLENHKAIGLLINTGPDPMENHKATRPAFNVGPPSVCQRKASQMAFCCWADDGSLLVVFGSSLLSLTKKKSQLHPL